jgi:hypothetical protein
MSPKSCEKGRKTPETNVSGALFGGDNRTRTCDLMRVKDYRGAFLCDFVWIILYFCE